jgi:hypothetical protein
MAPSNIPRNVPPTRCPLLPIAIGKFIICAAKTKALEIDRIAANECVYVALAFFLEINNRMMAAANVIIAIDGSMNPSLMCIHMPLVTLYLINVLP